MTALVEVEPSPAALLHGELARIHDKAGLVRVAAYEDAAWERVACELLPEVRASVSAGLSVLSDLLIHFEILEGPAPAAPARSGELFRRRSGDGDLRDRLLDVAHLGFGELRARRTALESSAQTGDAWQVVMSSGSCLGTLRKVLAAVEGPLAELGGLAARLQSLPELATSLAVRRAYSRFRAAIRSLQERATIQGRLYGAATHIAVLTGLDVYEHCRLGDRAQLRSLQNRLMEWQCVPQDEDAGRRLWTDILGFSELIGEVRRRQELVEHDSKVLAEGVRILAEPDGLSPERLHPVAESLLGWNDELDEWLLQPEVNNTEAVRRLLAQA